MDFVFAVINIVGVMIAEAFLRVYFEPKIDAMIKRLRGPGK